MSELMQTHQQIVDEKMICGKEHHCPPCREHAPSCSERTWWAEILARFSNMCKRTSLRIPKNTKNIEKLYKLLEKY